DADTEDETDAAERVAELADGEDDLADDPDESPSDLDTPPDVDTGSDVDHGAPAGAEASEPDSARDDAAGAEASEPDSAQEDAVGTEPELSDPDAAAPEPGSVSAQLFSHPDAVHLRESEEG